MPAAALLLASCGDLPHAGDTDGIQRAAHWAHDVQISVDTDPRLTIERIFLDTVPAGTGHDVFSSRFFFDQAPGPGDEYEITLALDLGPDARALPVGEPLAIGPRGPLHAVATIVCLCRPLRADSVTGTYRIDRRGIVQLGGRLEATLFFTEWADPSRRQTYQLRQHVEAVRF